MAWVLSNMTSLPLFVPVKPLDHLRTFAISWLVTKVTFAGWKPKSRHCVLSPWTTYIGAVLSLATTNRAFVPPPIEAAPITYVGLYIWPLRNTSPNANYVIKWATRLKIVPSWYPHISLLIVQIHHKKKKNKIGWLIRLPLITWPLIFQIFCFTLNMMVLIRWILVMDQIFLYLILFPYPLHSLIAHFTYVKLFVSLL